MLSNLHLPLARMCALAACTLGLAAHPALADDMGEGQARITNTSDVTMSVKSGVRTTSAKLEKVAAHLGTPLGDIKRCYANVVKDEPQVSGHIDATLTLPEKGPQKLEMTGSGVSHRRLTRCIDAALGKIKLEGDLRPAQAVVRLEFTNTAAEAADDVAAIREQMAQVKVKTADDGTLYSEDGTADGKVRFRIAGPDEAAITAAHHGLEMALPRLLDCRRRSSKLESPAGDIVFSVRIDKRGKADVDVKSSSVPHPNAGPCSRTALKRARYDKTPARAQVTVQFQE